MINSKLPPKTLTEFVAYAKQRPKELNYGSVGVGSSQHLAGAYFDQVAGVQLVHVPYRNIAQYTPDFIAGQVPLGFQFLPNVIGMLELGRRARARGHEPETHDRAPRRADRAGSRPATTRPMAGSPCSGRPECRSRSSTSSTRRWRRP